MSFRKRRKRKDRRKFRGTFLIPNLITTGSLFSGFYAIVSSINGRFESAALAILVAMVLDGLDGRLARLTQTTSGFGVQYDSLSDLVAFGVAPALLVYLWALQDFGRFGWVAAFLFVACGALRLARFNVQTRTVDSRYFVGLPCPAAAGAMVALFFAAPTSDALLTWAAWLRPQLVEGVMLLALVTVGSLMVSTFRYPSFKKIDLRQRWSYRAYMALAAGVLVLAYRPAAFLLTAAGIYTLSGPVSWLWGRVRRRDDEVPAVETDPSGAL